MPIEIASDVQIGDEENTLVALADLDLNARLHAAHHIALLGCLVRLLGVCSGSTRGEQLSQWLSSAAVLHLAFLFKRGFLDLHKVKVTVRQAMDEATLVTLLAFESKQLRPLDHQEDLLQFRVGLGP